MPNSVTIMTSYPYVSHYVKMHHLRNQMYITHCTVITKGSSHDCRYQ